jgi:hypothetical protein
MLPFSICENNKNFNHVTTDLMCRKHSQNIAEAKHYRAKTLLNQGIAEPKNY